MSRDEDWFRRRRRRFPFFTGGFFEDLEEMMEEMFKESEERIPKKMIRERKLPDGSTVREWGPFVYGYSMTVGPDGKPVIREFGNIRPGARPTPFGVARPTMEVKEKREPLTDIVEEEEKLRVIAEVPGVEKKDINLNCTDNSLTISVDTDQRKYLKELQLPAEVDPDSAKASYRNGVLEVTLNRKKKGKPKGREIEVE